MWTESSSKNTIEKTTSSLESSARMHNEEEWFDNVMMSLMPCVLAHRIKSRS